MKRLYCALLLILLAATMMSAAAAAKLSEATMIYEDYDGNHADWTVNDDAELKELVAMLERAKENPVKSNSSTMNCTLMCKVDGETIIAFEIATDSNPFITEMNSGKTYRMNDDDWARLWEIFEQIQEAMGYDASLVF